MYRCFLCAAISFLFSFRQGSPAEAHGPGQAQEHLPEGELFHGLRRPDGHLQQRFAVLGDGQNNGESGSITFIGTVSPAGGNLKEPVTENTKKVARCFYALEQDRADKKRYPAVNPIDSYSKYIDPIEEIKD